MRQHHFLSGIIASIAAAIAGTMFGFAQSPPASQGSWIDQATLQQTKSRRPPSVESPTHAARIGWWHEAKLGLFIHWGIYTVPAGVYNGKTIPGSADSMMKFGRIPATDYEKYAAQFNPEHFDADAWVRLAKDSGAQFIIVSAKDRDGFAMYDSHFSAFNSVTATPFHRDPLKELSIACAKQNLRFGFYYSQAEDWREPDAVGNTWDFPDEAAKNFDRYFLEQSLPQLGELLTNYGPISIAYFDNPSSAMTADRSAALEKIVHKLQPDCIIGGRVGAGNRGDYNALADNYISPTAQTGDWESGETLNNSWGNTAGDQNWKTGAELTFNLVDIVSKGGNNLLHVGADAQGVIPNEAQDALHKLGKWLAVNGEAIHDAGPTPYGIEFGLPSASNAFPADTNADANREWRCTTKPGKLYFTLFHIPANGTFIAPILPLQQKIKTAYLLADPGHTPLNVSSTPAATTFTLPANLSPDDAPVIVVETN